MDQLGLTTDKEGKYKTEDISATLQIAPDFKPKWKLIKDEIVFVKGEVNVYFQLANKKAEGMLLLTYKETKINKNNLGTIAGLNKLKQEDWFEDNFFSEGEKNGEFVVGASSNKFKKDTIEKNWIKSFIKKDIQEKFNNFALLLNPNWKVKYDLTSNINNTDPLKINDEITISIKLHNGWEIATIKVSPKPKDALTKQTEESTNGQTSTADTKITTFF